MLWKPQLKPPKTSPMYRKLHCKERQTHRHGLDLYLGPTWLYAYVTHPTRYFLARTSQNWYAR